MTEYELATLVLERWRVGATVFVGLMVPVVGYFLGRRQATLNSNLLQNMNEKLDADRRDASAAQEHLKSWLGEDVQRRLDAAKASEAKDLEGIRAQLTRLGQLETTAALKRAEVATE